MSIRAHGTGCHRAEGKRRLVGRTAENNRKRRVLQVNPTTGANVGNGNVEINFSLAQNHLNSKGESDLTHCTKSCRTKKMHGT